MRNMSFSLTTKQMRNRTKTVTRRIGWDDLKPGDRVKACVKCMGLKKGEKVTKLKKGETMTINGVVLKASRRVTIRAESLAPISLNNLDNEAQQSENA